MITTNLFSFSPSARRHLKCAVMGDLLQFLIQMSSITCYVLFSLLPKPTKYRQLFKKNPKKIHVRSSQLSCLSNSTTISQCLLSACASKTLAVISNSLLSAQNQMKTASWLLLFPLFQKGFGFNMMGYLWSAEKYSKILQEIHMFCLCSYHHRSQIYWFLCSKYILKETCVPSGRSWICSKSSTFLDVLLPSIYHLQTLSKILRLWSHVPFSVWTENMISENTCLRPVLAQNSPSIYSSSAIWRLLSLSGPFCSGLKTILQQDHILFFCLRTLYFTLMRLADLRHLKTIFCLHSNNCSKIS